MAPLDCGLSHDGPSNFSNSPRRACQSLEGGGQVGRGCASCCSYVEVLFRRLGARVECCLRFGDEASVGLAVGTQGSYWLAVGWEEFQCGCKLPRKYSASARGEAWAERRAATPGEARRGAPVFPHAWHGLQEARPVRGCRDGPGVLSWGGGRCRGPTHHWCMAEWCAAG
jgi:hypothetical protein